MKLAKVRAMAKDGRVQDIRVRAGVSQAETAEPVGVSAVTIHRWESVA